MKRILLLLTTAFIYIQAFSQWQSTSLIGHTVLGVSANANFMFAGSDSSKIYISNNFGNTWSSVHISGNNITTTAKVLMKDSFLIAATNNRTWTSADTGVTWTQTLSPFYILYPSEVLSFDSVIISCGLGGAMYVSSDYGYHWTFSGGTISSDGNSLAISGDSIFLGTGNGLYFTTDLGAVCTPINNGLIPSNGDILCQAISGNEMYVGTGANGVYYSSDHGAHWVPRDTGITNHSIHAIAAIGSFVCAGTPAGVFVSMNSGLTWTLMNGGLGINYYVNNLTVIGNEFYVSTFGGLYKTSITTLSTEEINAFHEFKLFPNPNNGNFTISEPEKGFDKSTLKLLNLLGEEIPFSIETKNNGVDIHLHSSTPGIYTLFYSKGNSFKTGKIVVQ